MRKIIIILVGLGSAYAINSAYAEDGCPPGQRLFPMSGSCKPYAPATTYAQCVKNSKAFGYAAADAEHYCKEKFQR